MKINVISKTLNHREGSTPLVKINQNKTKNFFKLEKKIYSIKLYFVNMNFKINKHQK